MLANTALALLEQPRLLPRVQLLAALISVQFDIIADTFNNDFNKELIHETECYVSGLLFCFYGNQGDASDDLCMF